MGQGIRLVPGTALSLSQAKGNLGFFAAALGLIPDALPARA
jgi:hypothetical protein